MADQHLDLRSVASEAFDFVDGVEEVLVNVVVLDDASGSRSFLVMWHLLRTRVGDTVFNPEFLQLVLVDWNAKTGLQHNKPNGDLPIVPANRANFPLFPRKPSF